MQKINASIFILAGGKGKRLWPLSRKGRPKQVLPVSGGASMIKETFDRLRRIIGLKDIQIITVRDQLNSIKKELPEIRNKNFIIEPEARGTLPAVGLAALKMKKEDPSGVMVIMPADHYIEGKEEFKKTILRATRTAEAEDSLITIGIRPAFASCRYGYLKFGKRVRGKGGFVYSVDKFIEKPSKKTALKFVKSGKYYYNSGIFIWKADTFLKELKSRVPSMYKKLMRIEKKIDRFDNQRSIGKIASIYKKIRHQTVDYGLMQKARNIKAVKATFKWSDLGGFRSLGPLASKTKTNAIFFARHIGKDTRNSLIYGQKDHLIATLGVSDLIIVQTPDVTLVANIEDEQEIKALVEKISKDKKLGKFA
jgi:mannose-1-phosphate guanylyltransferase